MSAEPAWSKYVILLFSSFMVLSAGTLYGFGAYSANLADALNRSDVNMLGSFGDAGLYTGIILGLFNDKFGPVSTLLVAAFLCWLGNIVMYMAVEGTIDTSTNFGILAAAYYCLGQGSYGFYFVAVALNPKNFSAKSSGKVYGYILMLFGLSALVYVSIYSKLLDSSVSDYFFFLSIALPITGLLTVATIKIMPFLTRRYMRDQPLLVNADKDLEIEDSANPDEIPSVTGLALFKLPTWWLVFVIFVLLSGPGLMWKNVIGSIVKSYPELGPTDKDLLVSSWSITNAGCRIVAGIMSDLFFNKFHMPKPVWLIVAAVVMALGHFQFAVFSGTDSWRGSLWVANLATAIGYGMQFTCVTALVGTYFGKEGLGLKIGMSMLAPFVGGTIMTAMASKFTVDHYHGAFLFTAFFSGLALLCGAALTRLDILSRKRLDA